MTLQDLWVEIRFLPKRLKMDLGAALNALRFPGFVRPCVYEAGIYKGTVRVALRPFFTVITVNGLDIYFSRLTGKIDGVGFGPSCGIVADQEQTHR